MTSQMPRIGWTGLGAMGGGMATNLVKKGFKVTGYDVYQPLVDKFVQAGGTAAKTPKEAANGVDFFISMVANAAQNEALLFDGSDAAIHSIGQHKTFILCSTCPPDFAIALRKRFDDAGRSDIRLLDCPVSGGTIRAADGTLSIFESGPEEHLEAAHEVLQSMSANLYRMGPIPNGSKTKCVHQLLAATNIISASEAMGIAATVGLNTQAVYEHVNESDGASFMFENRVPHMLKNDWSPFSALGIILKDASIVTAVARQEAFATPLVSTAEQEYFRGVGQGLLKDDDAKLVQMYLPRDKSDLVSVKAEADIKMVKSHQISKEMVADLLAGIHLAASMECMAFCKKLGIDRKLMYEIVSKAAGWSAIFVKHIPGMLEKDSWCLEDCAAAESVGSSLATIVEKCHLIKYPCPMAEQALTQFAFARL
ncbi:hypothetical protein AMS68_005537 [Peltaster fructicola]|uniref:6-phosphogluconate dehydrogenase NADP-binding domain-containing protein n=1 Tax=Peltaster fructicola TaxID=286661 RepID=A0A6H0Y039_9PEZI|nr:hypothetical protein AMS68_005537 [Peltaster fructicola]